MLKSLTLSSSHTSLLFVPTSEIVRNKKTLDNGYSFTQKKRYLTPTDEITINWRMKQLFPQGTSFQQKVWRAIQKIPYGETRPYQWIAKKIGRPKAVRAVGQACKANPLPLLIPCHRVVASHGKIGGFTPSLRIKRLLLQLEKESVKRLK